MIKLIRFAFFIIFGINLYSQMPDIPNIPDINLNYSSFLNLYLNSSGMYNNLSEETINNLTSNATMNEIFQRAIEGMSITTLIQIMANPENLLKQGNTEASILLLGTTLGFLEAANMQLETSSLVIDSLKSKVAFNAGSGNNNGLLIPMHTPIGSFGLNLYVDTPIFDIQKAKTYPVEDDGKDYDSVSDYKSISDAVKVIPIPHLNAYFQINFGPVPMSLTLRGGMAFGFKDLFGAVINDVEVEAVGYNIGLSLKALLFRTKYFFGDFRTDFNFDSSKIGLAVKSRYIYVPLNATLDTGDEAGVVFNGNAFLEAKWKAVAISPKIVLGFKFKERVPAVQYFSAYFSFGADITYGIIDSKIGINGIGSYANIEGHTLTINDLNIPDSTDKKDYWHYDMRIGFHVDIFYQSFSVEYSILSKQFAFSIIPINIRF